MIIYMRRFHPSEILPQGTLPVLRNEYHYSLRTAGGRQSHGLSDKAAVSVRNCPWWRSMRSVPSAHCLHGGISPGQALQDDRYGLKSAGMGEPRSGTAP